ncbi:hypothetical protein B9Z55_012721 [Caenorhabditis nigoni]|uniref:Uncharacterized protein n=1 Tax=Caenorhabditis nigoni TaxID=1611254 RepID=A0A2G5TYK6_9PELO|nr:hypothetical protein B9Z55_012721 [Caenorhabditis nigoni]
MTKLGFSESSGNPEKLLEDGNCYTEWNEQDGTELDFVLSWVSPYPIYGLLILLMIYDKCILDFFPISLVFMLGAIFSFEMLHLILFCPPKNHRGGDLDVMDFTKYSSEGKMTTLKEVHFFCTLM